MSCLDEKLANATIIADALWQNNSKFHRDKSLKLLIKIYENIKNNPNERRYRRVNIFKIESKHSIVSEFRDLLLASGFICNVDGIHIELNDNNLDLCTAVYSMIKDRINYENEQIEIERRKIMANTRRKQQQYMNARIRKKEAVKQRMEIDRKDTSQDRKDKPVYTSKARDLKYWKSHNIYNPNQPNLPTVDDDDKNDQ